MLFKVQAQKLTEQQVLKQQLKYKMNITSSWCFKSIYSLQVKDSAKSSEILARCIAYMLQEPFKKELERLQHKILAPLRVDEMAEWCNSYVILPKSNGTVCLCLDPARLNQTLITLVNKGPTLNDILPELTNVSYMTIINASSGYDNLELD